MSRTSLAIDIASSPDQSPVVGRVAAELAPVIGESRWRERTWEQIQCLAGTSGLKACVGEAGTGKTLLARHLHWQSERGTAPCEFVDLRRIPVEHVEAELFGCARGGILHRRDILPGRVAAAGAGTCILQGFERLPAALQERCLPWIVEGRIHPVGSSESVEAQAQVVLEIQGRDLSRGRGWTLIPPLYRLLEDRVVSVDPLSRRREDILPIANHYLRQQAEAWGLPLPALTSDVTRLLKRAPWRGNVRELIAAIAGALVEAKGTVIEAKHLPPTIMGQPSPAADAGIEACSLEELIDQKLERFFSRLGQYEVQELYSTVLARVERPLFRRVLEQTGGNQVRAARILGINRNTLRTRLRKLGLMSGKG